MSLPVDFVEPAHPEGLPIFTVFDLQNFECSVQALRREEQDEHTFGAADFSFAREAQAGGRACEPERRFEITGLVAT